MASRLSFFDFQKECIDNFHHANNDDIFKMSILLELLEEHALSLDFGMFLLIWIVQVIIYPSFRFIDDSNFTIWHRSYCNLIGFFVLPIMVCQLIQVSSACFFSVGNFIWLKLIGVLSAWLITFFISAPCHRQLQWGKNLEVIDRLIRTNWWRSILWSFVFLISLYLYHS